MYRSKPFWIALLALLSGTAAGAHTGVDAHLHTGFMSGFMHPLTGLDHLCAMLTVGVWSALVAHRAGRGMLVAPLGFANMLLVGAAVGLQRLEAPALEPLVAATVVACGLLLALRQRVPGLWAAALAGAFAVFHGLVHGHELADQTHAFEALAGMLCATLLLHAAGLVLGWYLRNRSAWLPRLLGAGVASVGGMLLLGLN